ncbi:MAG: Crp/Fnr family transcriptional regulator [Lachnospiraceae bacterium]|uniref:Crp/Fnr family transcriptional regulator n=1 Tax=Parablautia sp. Marseille-Q6255 TaxID=3039593 RepID=UPI0024BD18C0|nr:Crp/Fnr family transcriptional regulator [Parablautia sp. Marseille-Q6255]
MTLKDYFPIWDRLTAAEQATLNHALQRRHVEKGTLLHNGSSTCEGLFLIISGQLRAFLASEEGREITIYRLFEHDICLFSASCMMSSIQFEITIEAEKDSELLLIPSSVYRKLMDTSLPIANYTNELMASHFSEAMWLIEQIMWKSFDRRLAAFLVEESAVEQTDILKITHERIAAHLGTAREVVTRMLRYFQSEGMVCLTRGTVELTDRKKLQELA